MDKLNLLNQRFGKLTVIEELHTEKNGRIYNVFWRCKCDCGKEKITKTKNLRAHIGKSWSVKSCGCLRGRKRLSEKERLIRHKFREYIKSAKDRGYSFEINDEQFRYMIFDNCYYCGKKPVPTKVSPTPINGIDRINNEEGYVLNNIVSCCNLCNRMKGTYTKELFFEQIKDIYERHICQNK